MTLAMLLLGLLAAPNQIKHFMVASFCMFDASHARTHTQMDGSRTQAQSQERLKDAEINTLKQSQR
jgi:hypothetical protein